MRSFLLAIFTLIAHTTFAQDTATLSGNIQNPLSDSMVLSYNSNYLAYYPNEYFAHVDKKGNFSLAFPVPNGVYTQVTLHHGNKLAEIILRAGDSLVMAVNAAHFDSTIHYKGRGSEIQNFVALHSLQKGMMNQYSLKTREAINKEPADFLKIIDREKNAELDLLNKNKTGLPASFREYWTAYYTYYNYFFRQQYPQVHEMIKYRKYTDTVPEINYSVVKDMPGAFNDTLMQLPPYLLYLTGFFDIQLKAAGYTYYSKDTMKKRRFEDSAYTLAYKLMPDKSAEYFIAQNIYGRAKMQELERTENQFSTFKKHWPNSQYMELLSFQIAMAEKLAPGRPAPDIDITTPDGKTIKLSDLRGKVVYLSFWASWCRQCVGEIISEHKIKTLTAGKPLEFVYVSIDDDTTADNTIITKYKLTGLFTHASGEWGAKEVQLYGVQQIPAYFLIDEDGNFAVQNPATPMQPTDLVLEIERLFK